MKENEIQRAIRLALGDRKLFPDVVLWRNSVGFDQFNRQRFGLVNGAADLCGILTVNGIGVSLWIEVKTATGRLSDDQQLFRDLVTRHGAIYILARSVDDAIRGIQAARERLR